MDETERLTRGEIILCAVMIGAGALIVAAAVHILYINRQATAVTSEAEAMTARAASERLGG